MGIKKQYFNDTIERNNIILHIVINILNMLYHLIKISVQYSLVNKNEKDVITIIKNGNTANFVFLSILLTYMFFDLYRLIISTRSYYNNSYLKYSFTFYVTALVFFFVFIFSLSLDLSCRFGSTICDKNYDWIITLVLYISPPVVLLIMFKPNDYI